MYGRCERGDDRGDAVWMLVVLASLIAVIGLVSEAGQILSVKREAERVSFEAARAGAVEVSLNSLYRGDEPYLDRDAAEAEASSWVSSRGFTPTIDFHEGDPNPRVIEVTVTKQHTFLWGIFGTGATIEASSRAVAADGASAAGAG